MNSNPSHEDPRNNTSRFTQQANPQFNESIIQDPFNQFNPGNISTTFVSQNPVPMQATNIALYENVRVVFPIVKNAKIKSYMIYNVKYVHNGREFEVKRRFSDFKALRDSLRKHAPCHYIYPAHKKRTLVG